MMLRFRDLNLNHSVQVFGDSGMDSLKQEMLKHEFIFRNQVKELHHLYWTQKKLMNEFQLKMFNSHPPSCSSLVALTGSKDSEDKRSAFLISSQAMEMWNSLSPNVGALGEFKGHSLGVLKNQEIDFNLHFPADDFIRGDSKNHLAFCHPRISQVHFTVDGSLGGFNEENSLYNSSIKGKKTIDMEESVVLKYHDTPDMDFSDSFRAPMLIDADLFGSNTRIPCGQVSLSILENQMHQMPSAIHLNEENDGRMQEHKPVFSPFGLDSSCVTTSANQPRRKHLASPILFDLNEPFKHDEQTNSCPVVDSIEHNLISSANTAVKTSCDTRGVNSLDSKLDLNIKTDSDDSSRNSAGMTFDCHIPEECCEKTMQGSTDSYQVFACINTVSVSSMNLSKQVKDDVGSLPDNLQSTAHSDIDIKGQDSNVTSSNSTNLPQTVINRDLITKPANNELSEEDTSSSHEAQVLNAHSRKDVCSSLERSADDSTTTQLSYPQNNCSYVGKFKPEEHGAAVSAAAKILIDISLGCSTIPIEPTDVFPVLEPESNDISSLPQYSSDSFECMTLQLSEVQSEDHCSAVNLPRVSETGRNGSGLRLRRGRGFRDFQKEILPGLLTLSRHEICEDLQNIGHKRRRIVSTNARNSWFVPVKSRRSKLPSGRRRR